MLNKETFNKSIINSISEIVKLGIWCWNLIDFVILYVLPRLIIRTRRSALLFNNIWNKYKRLLHLHYRLIHLPDGNRLITRAEK